MSESRREVWAWMLYDWASSTFPATVVSALLGPYLTSLAQAAVGENGIVLSLGPLGSVTAKSLYPLCVALSVGLQALLLPLLGAVADYSRLKKPLLVVFCYSGVACTCLLATVTSGRHLLGGLLFTVANWSFGAGSVLYNAFLPEIVAADRRDAVSSRGYALGYFGGGLVLALNLVLVTLAPRLGLTIGAAVRISLLSAGVWWGGFALVTFWGLRSRGARRTLPPGATLLGVGWSELGATLRVLRALPHTLRYLLAYLLYNDGIQTVVSVASVVLAQELFVARGLAVDQGFLLKLLLTIQFVAFAGALLFERIAAAGAKNAILLALVGWTGAVIYACATLESTTQAWILSILIATVLGGSQALSRSLFSRMIPAGREAAFFGLYEISDKGTSWLGPLLFGVVVAMTNSYRQALLSLVVLFAAGMLVLFATDTERAERDARSGNGPSAPPSPLGVAGAAA
jgi:UMF1 family MFS transporter